MLALLSRRLALSVFVNGCNRRLVRQWNIKRTFTPILPSPLFLFSFLYVMSTTSTSATLKTSHYACWWKRPYNFYLYLTIPFHLASISGRWGLSHAKYIPEDVIDPIHWLGGISTWKCHCKNLHCRKFIEQKKV